MEYVLKHYTTGQYVAPGGQEHSYVDRLEDAQVFRTRDEAVRNSCPLSEYPVSLKYLMDKGRVT